MLRKVRFERRVTYEITVPIPDGVAKGPEEKTWLQENLSDYVGIQIDQSVITGLVVGEDGEDLSEVVI